MERFWGKQVNKTCIVLSNDPISNHGLSNFIYPKCVFKMTIFGQNSLRRKDLKRFLYVGKPMVGSKIQANLDMTDHCTTDFHP